MTVQFNIEYKAMFGEQIVVNIQTEEGEASIHFYSFIFYYFVLIKHLFLLFCFGYSQKNSTFAPKSALRHCKGNKNDKINVIKRVSNCYLHGIILRKIDF